MSNTARYVLNEKSNLKMKGRGSDDDGDLEPRQGRTLIFFGYLAILLGCVALIFGIYDDPGKLDRELTEAFEAKKREKAEHLRNFYIEMAGGTAPGQESRQAAFLRKQQEAQMEREQREEAQRLYKVDHKRKIISARQRTTTLRQASSETADNTLKMVYPLEKGVMTTDHLRQKVEYDYIKNDDGVVQLAILHYLSDEQLINNVKLHSFQSKLIYSEIDGSHGRWKEAGLHKKSIPASFLDFQLYAELSSFLNETFNVTLSGGREEHKMLTYRQNSYQKLNADIVGEPLLTNHRQVGLKISYSYKDDYGGGEFAFPDLGYQVKLNAGDILVIPSDLVYEVKNVDSGRLIMQETYYWDGLINQLKREWCKDFQERMKDQKASKHIPKNNQKRKGILKKQTSKSKTKALDEKNRKNAMACRPEYSFPDPHSLPPELGERFRKKYARLEMRNQRR